MKRSILFFSLIVCVAMCAESQNNRFSWGVKAGFNMSGAMFEHKELKAGYQAGLVCEYRFSHLIAMASELVFSSEGWREKRINICFDWEKCENIGSDNICFNYINLPVMAKFYVSDKFSVDFGPQIGVKVHMPQLSINNSDYYNTFQFGLGLGGTYNFRKMFVQARYNVGLINVHKDLSSKQYNIQIAVGYKFK